MTTQYKWLPEQPTTEMVNRVFNKLGKEVDKEFFILMWKMMWQSAAEVEQEPVTYMLHVYGENVYTAHPEDFSDKAVVTPLYTHPQPKQSEQVELKREPLSEEEIFNLFTQQNFTAYKIHDGTDHNDAVAVDRAFIDFARAIEKFHGIGVEK